jgi:hypothetical protein
MKIDSNLLYFASTILIQYPGIIYLTIIHTSNTNFNLGLHRNHQCPVYHQHISTPAPAGQLPTIVLMSHPQMHVMFSVPFSSDPYITKSIKVKNDLKIHDVYKDNHVYIKETTDRNKEIKLLNYSHSRNPRCAPARTHGQIQAPREPPN